jgi:uncharacterized membrane protein
MAFRIRDHFASGYYVVMLAHAAYLVGAFMPTLFWGALGALFIFIGCRVFCLPFPTHLFLA